MTESLTHHIIKRAVDTCSECENDLAELKLKYKKLLNFVKSIKCPSCFLGKRANDLLKEMGEL